MSSLPLEYQQLLISDYVLNDLNPDEALLLAEIIADNPDLIEEIKETQQALDLVYNPPEITPPAYLRDRILAAAQAQKTATSANSTVETENSSS